MRKSALKLILPLLILLTGCTASPSQGTPAQTEAPQDLPVFLEETAFPEAVRSITGSLELKYAEQYSIDYYSDGSALVTINESGQFLVVPEGIEPPDDIGTDLTVLRQPIKNIYLQATSAMCLFDALDALGHITMSGTKTEGWYIDNARAAMERGEIVYAGKYSAPDYELLTAKKCGLAIESTMLNHNPEVKEKLELLGIPVMIERSSYETHPLGRTEWIKLYGLLCGKEKQAEELFDKQIDYLNNISAEDTGKTAAFFYISSTGNAVARKSGDYVVKMIELAGGNYVFSDIGNPDTATGSVNLEMERFYAGAKDADIIIYNSSIDGEVHTLDELLAKSHLLADFKAVKNGDVWCTSKNLFQETTEFGQMISDMNRIFTEEADDLDDLRFLYRLR